MWWDFDFSLEALACWGECHTEWQWASAALCALSSMFGRSLWKWFNNGILILPACAASQHPGSFSFLWNPQGPFCILSIHSWIAQSLLSIKFWLVKTVPQALQNPQAWPPVPPPSVPLWHSQCISKTLVDTGVGVQGEESPPDTNGKCGTG